MKQPRPSLAKRAFSLVEMTTSLGVMSFAMVAVLGLLPVGMKAFQEADTQARYSRHGQDWLTVAQQTDFSALSSLAGEYYYDQDGLEVKKDDPSKIVTVTLKVESQVTLPGFNPSSNHLAHVLVEVTQNGREPAYFSSFIARADSNKL